MEPEISVDRAKSQNEKTNLSESELIEIYNHVPQVLSRKVIKVSIPENYNSRDRLILTEEQKGNYWVIAAEEETYLLLPKGYYKINEFNIQAVNYLFDCQGFQAKDTREFILKKPARVSPLLHQPLWKLEAKGILEFGDKSTSELEQEKTKYDRLQSHLEQVTKERDRLTAQVAQLASDKLQEIRSQLVTKDEFQRELKQVKEERSQLQIKLSSLEAQLKQERQERSQADANYDKWSQEMTKYVSYLSTQLEQIEQYIRANQRLNAISSNPSVRHKSDTSTPQSQSENISSGKFIKLEESTEICISQSEADLVIRYNSDLNDLFQQAIEVCETDDSINQRRLGGSQPIILEASRRGNYWIITEGNFEYVVPKNNLNISWLNYPSIEILFECYDYHANYSRLELLKPAKVSTLPGVEIWGLWELVERGVLRFL
jgi:hypothetical protein